MDVQQIKENFPLKSGELINGIKFIEYFFTDKHGNHICEFECPRCGGKIITQLNNIQSGHTKSCGCLRTERAEILKKKNKSFHICDIPSEEYVKVFFTNHDGYFLTDAYDYNKIENYCWSAAVRTNRAGEVIRVVPITTLDAKTVRLSKFLMNPPPGMEVDHINHETNDFRRINLRICTKQQNLYNREIGQGLISQNESGKYIIINFALVDTVDLEFDTFAEANETLFELQDTYMGEYSYRRSQEKAKEHDTHEFDIDNGKVLILGSVIEIILKLPQDDIRNIILHNIIRRERKKIYTEDQATTQIFKLISDCKARVFD